jgi:hypothetical protein
VPDAADQRVEQPASENMTTHCEHCGTDNPTPAVFCRQCGARLAEPALRPVTPASPLVPQWRRLKYRLTRKEVRALLGEPARVEATASTLGNVERWSYEYEQIDKAAARLAGTVEFTLPDGIVTAWSEPDWSRLGGVK